jgi:hypothetical protein
MANLKKREIIILVITALFILYAGYEYLIAGPASKKVNTSEDSVKIETFISGLTNDLSKNKISDFDGYVVRKTGVDWVGNPFLKKDLYKTWAGREGFANNSALAKIIYSGFIDSGKNKIAVLNGVEYRTGEQLEIKGYILKQIMPSKVLIFDKSTGNDLEIPIQE